VIRSALLATTLVTPPLAGPIAVIGSVLALAVPTAFLSLDQSLPAGACCTTYLPFVILSAVLMGPLYASIVAIGSAGLADALFMGTRYHLFETPMDSFGNTTTLVSSALVIGLVCLFRKVLARQSRARTHQSKSGVIFSLEKGVAWASWTGSSNPVNLGPQEEVAKMMRDFLAQLELGRRLANRSS